MPQQSSRRAATETSDALVTIITPCFNHEKYLDDYFRGLLCQTYENIELILFDDGSTDRSWEVIESYRPRLERRFSRLVCERHENIGSVLERAQALRIAKGDYVCMLDSDDYYHADKIAENVAFLDENRTFGVVYSDFDELTERGFEPASYRRIGIDTPSGHISEALCRDSFILPLTVCFRRQLLERYVSYVSYHERGYGLSDYPSLLVLSQHTRFGYIDKALACRRHVRGSLSRPRDVEKWVDFTSRSFRALFDHMADYQPTEDTRAYAEGLRDNFLVLSAARLLLAGRARKSFGCLRDANVLRALMWLPAHGPSVWRRHRHRF